MKVSIATMLLILTLSRAHAQVEGCAFSPQNGGTLYLPIKKPFQFHLNARAGLQARGNVWEAYFGITGPNWAKIEPTSFTAGWGNTSVDVTITLESDTPTCHTYYPWISMNDSKNTVWAGYGFGVSFYDPNIIGHTRLIRDTLHFNSGRVGDSTWVGVSPYFNSYAVFRSFKATGIRPPFHTYDSFPMNYGCYDGSSGRIWFRPTKAGSYIDTAYLVDPLTKDSIQLLLIGDAYDAAVTEEAAQPLKLYPNPCDRTLTIELPDVEFARVEIHNLLGEEVYSTRVLGNEASVGCSSLPDGVYVASVTARNSHLTRKVVVAH